MTQLLFQHAEEMAYWCHSHKAGKSQLQIVHAESDAEAGPTTTVHAC